MKMHALKTKQNNSSSRFLLEVLPPTKDILAGLMLNTFDIYFMKNRLFICFRNVFGVEDIPAFENFSFETSCAGLLFEFDFAVHLKMAKFFKMKNDERFLAHGHFRVL